MRRFALAFAVLLPFAVSGQELADAQAARAYADWADATAEALSRRGTAREALVAVLFDRAAARSGKARGSSRPARAWAEALALGIDDPLVHWIAAADCPVAACDRAAALAALQRLEPDNGAIWTLVLDDALARRDATAARDALAAIARAERYDTHHGELFAAIDAALASIPVPESVRTHGDDRFDEATARGVALFNVVLQVATPYPARFKQYCTPGIEAAFEARRADCAAAGERMATRSPTLDARFAGARIWRAAAHGTPDEARARQVLVDLHWQAEQFGALGTTSPQDTGPAIREQLERRRTHRSEVASIEAALAAAGIAARPPPGYVPREPVD